MSKLESLYTVTTRPLSGLTDSTLREWKQLAIFLRANFSLLPGWTKITAESHGLLSHSEVVTVHKDDELVAILPLTVSCSRFFGIELKILELITNRISYHNVPISALSTPHLLDVLVDLAVERGAEAIRLEGVPSDSDFGKYVEENPITSHYEVVQITGSKSPYLPIRLNWTELLASKPKKFRYKVRKRAETMDVSTDLTMRWFKAPEDCAQLIESMRDIEGSSWKKDAGVSLFEREHENRYHLSLLPFLAANDAMFANVLYHGTKPIAYNLCCIWSGWVGQMKTSFNADHSDLSPGAIVIDHAIRHAIEIGANEFDFLGEKDQHKLAWTKNVRPHITYFIYVRSRIKGRIFGRLKNLRNRIRRKA